MNKVLSKSSASIFCLFLLATIAHASSMDSLVLRASEVDTWIKLNQMVKFHMDKESRPAFQALDSSSQLELASDDLNGVPLEDSQYPHFFKLTIQNDQTEQADFFFASLYGGPSQISRLDERGKSIQIINAQQIKSTLLTKDVFPLSVPAGATYHYAVRVDLLIAPNEWVNVYLIPAHLIHEFISAESDYDWYFEIESKMFVGMILMMFFYIIVKYFQVRSSVYLLYAGYIFFFFAYFFLRQISMWSSDLDRAPIYYAYIDQMLQMAAYCMYFPFAQRFLNTKVILPKIHPWLTRIVWVMIAYAIIDLILLYVPSALIFRWKMWDAIRIFLLVAELVFTILLLRAKSPYIKLMVIGTATLAFFAMLSMIFSIDDSLIAFMPIGFDEPLAYFYIGVILEILFFASILGYKNRRDEVQKIQAQEALKREAERFEFQQYRAVMEALEGERGRIAKDLHDGLGGMLSGVKFSLTNIKSKLSISGDQDLLYERALDQLGSSIQELRRVAHDMMPDVLIRHGLSVALEDFCQAMNGMQVIKVVFQSLGKEKRLESYREIIVYRITQELITNVIRHAKATELLVQVVYEANQLAITVEDNGQGFDKSLLGNHSGMGLSNIQSRVAFLNGHLNINSTLGTGTSVYIEMPI